MIYSFEARVVSLRFGTATYAGRDQGSGPQTSALTLFSIV